MKIMSVLMLMKLMSKGTPDIRSILDLLFPFYTSLKLIPLLAVIHVCPSGSPQTRIVITCFGQKSTVCCPVELNTLSLTLALDVGGWSTPRHATPRHATPRHASAALFPGRRRGTHCTGGLVGSRAALDGRGKFYPHQDSIPGHSSP
jgi:hypothetical protein